MTRCGIDGQRRPNQFTKPTMEAEMTDKKITCAGKDKGGDNGGDLRGMPADLSKFHPPTPTYEQLMGWNKK
jgi:hypothetical protein